MLCFGMFSCAKIIEKCTSEIYYKKQDKNTEIYWVQPGGQEVGDQIFEACALKGDKNRIDYILSSFLYTDKTWETWPLLLVFTTMCGFILQFIGLRAMHSSVAMAQLGATLVMGLVRSGLRTQRTTVDQNIYQDVKREAEGHELDCLAMKLEDIKAWEVTNLSSVHTTAADYIPSIDYTKPPADVIVKYVMNVAVKTMKIRAQLAEMTLLSEGNEWGTNITNVSQRLAKTMEEIMNVIFAGDTKVESDWERISEFPWILPITCVDKGDVPIPYPVSLKMVRPVAGPSSPSISWKVDGFDIEAVLGLWVWSIQSRKARRTTSYRRMVAQFRGYDTAKAREEYKLWIQRASQIKDDRIDDRHSTGLNEEYFGWPGFDKKPTGSSVLYVTRGADAPQSNKLLCEDLVTMCAQDLFIFFFKAVTEIISNIGGSTKPRANNPTMDVGLEESMLTTSWDVSCFVLNTQLHKMAEVFVNNNLGSREEAYICMIPTLRNAKRGSKVPSLESAHRTAEAAAAILQDTDWVKASDFLKWVCKSCTNQQSDYFEAKQKNLGELYRQIMRKSLNGYLAARRSQEPSKDVDMEEFKNTFLKVLDGIRDMVQAVTKTSELYTWMAVQMVNEGISKEMLTQAPCLQRYEKKMKDYNGSNNLNLISWVKRMYSVGSENRVGSIEDLERRESESRVVVQLLLGHEEVDINMQEDGRTALSFAAEHKDRELVRLLLTQTGIKLNTLDKKGWKPLSYALQSQDETTMQLFLDGDISYVNEKNSFGMTPLMIATECGDRKGVRLLTSKAVVNLEIQDHSGNPALSIAASRNYGRIVELLLNKKANIEAGNNRKCTPLILAAMKGHIDVVKLLLNYGANVDAEDTDRRSALHLAAEGDHVPVVETLLKNRDILTPKDIDGWDPLIWAAKNGYFKIATLLLDKFGDKRTLLDGVDSASRTALSWAVCEEHLDVVKLLIKSGCSINKKDTTGHSPLLLAVVSGDIQIVELLLLETGLELDVVSRPLNRTPLHIAIYENNEKIAGMLLDRGARPDIEDSNNQTALSLCASLGREEIIKLLLKCQQTPLIKKNARDRHGRTPLMLAVQAGHELSIRLLLAQPDVDRETQDPKWGQSLLSWAARNGHSDLIDLLTKNGADPNYKSFNEKTPLSWAAENGHIKTVEGLLLNEKVDKNFQDVQKRTPLIWATRNGHTSIVETLINHGADVELADRNGQTPLSWAAERGHADIAELLISKVNDINRPDTRWGRTPLFWARMNQHHKTASVLLKNNAAQI